MGDTKKSGDDFLGERFGDWVITSKAKAENRKRMWQVTNTQTDETRVVAQTELKNLENDVPSSHEITASVLSANFRHDPFNIPDGVFPDDESEFPFEPQFTEAPSGSWVELEDHRGFVFDPEANPLAQARWVPPAVDGGSGRRTEDNPFAGCSPDPDAYDEDEEIEGAEEFVTSWVAPRDDVRGLVVLAMQQQDALRDTLDQILKASVR